MSEKLNYFQRCNFCGERAFQFTKNPEKGVQISENDIIYQKDGKKPFECQNCGKEIMKDTFGGNNLVARPPVTYHKYKGTTPIHWTWYRNGNEEYVGLVDTSVKFLEGCKGSILDIGFGDGLIASFLIKQGLNVIGVEPEKDGIIAGERMGVRTKVHNKTIEDYVKGKIDDVDYMYSMNTIEHVNDAKCYLEIMKHVKNFAVVVTDNAINKLGQRRQMKDQHIKEFTYEELENLFKDYKTEKLDIKDPSFIAIKIYGKTN